MSSSKKTELPRTRRRFSSVISAREPVEDRSRQLRMPLSLCGTSSRMRPMMKTTDWYTFCRLDDNKKLPDGEYRNQPCLRQCVKRPGLRGGVPVGWIQSIAARNVHLPNSEQPRVWHVYQPAAVNWVRTNSCRAAHPCSATADMAAALVTATASPQSCHCAGIEAATEHGPCQFDQLAARM